MLRIFSRMDLASVFVCVVGSAFFLQNAHAITTLKKIQVVDSNQIELLFDSKIQNSQIQIEYSNDIIQISLNDVSVYPAKMNTLSGPDFLKVFAYQYSPRQVRCRFTIKGKAENYRGKVEIKANGKQISVRSNRAEASIPAVSNEERSLLDRVMKAGSAETPARVVAAPQKVPAENSLSKKETAKEGAAKEHVVNDALTTGVAQKSARSLSETKLTNGKPLPGVGRSLGVLIVICLMFAGAAYALKRGLRGPRLEKNRKLHKFLNTMGKSLGIGMLGKKGKVVEVIANHYLGPKKSISVVKIAGKTLVLGVTSENINLIAQLDRDLEDEEVDEVLLDSLGAVPNARLERQASVSNQLIKQRTASSVYNQSISTSQIGNTVESNSGPQFSDLFQAESTRPQLKAPVQNSGVRDRIRSRIEGMKSL